MDVDIEYEQLTLKALKYSQEKNPSKVPTVKTLQGIVSKYCRDQNVEELNWRNTNFGTLQSFLKHLELKNYISLAGNQILLNNTEYKNSTELKSKKRKRTTAIKKKKQPSSNPEYPTFPSFSPPLINLVFPSLNTKLSDVSLGKENISISINPNLIAKDATPINLCGEEMREIKRFKAELEEEDLPKCPVCNQCLPAACSPKELNEHIDECLTLQMLNSEKKPPSLPPSVHLPQSKDKALFVVQVLENNLEIPNECSICFDSFLKGHKTVRLDCLCLYHEECFVPWFEKSPFCPLHIPVDQQQLT